MVGYKVVNNNYIENIGGHITKLEVGKKYHREIIREDIPEGSPTMRIFPTVPFELNIPAPFHFFKDLMQLFNNYACYPNMRILEINADKPDELYTLGYQSNDIEVIRELSKEEIIRTIDVYDLVKSDNSRLREIAAIYGCGLDILINDDSIDVRSAVAEQGYGSEILVYDDESLVRSSVALSGKGLNILINDSSSMVRSVVASQGYGVDRLKRDPYKTVRTVANHYITYFM